MNILYTCNGYNIVHKLYFIKKRESCQLVMTDHYEADLRELDEETKAGETKGQWIRPNFSSNMASSFCSIPTGHSASE